jgi:hypothetical protein
MMPNGSSSLGNSGVGGSSGAYHSLGNGTIDGSPLKLFSRSKQAINSIYQEFYTFIGEIYQFLDCKKLHHFCSDL